jgi:predicted outer membrane repeat protein
VAVADAALRDNGARDVTADGPAGSISRPVVLAARGTRLDLSASAGTWIRVADEAVAARRVASRVLRTSAVAMVRLARAVQSSVVAPVHAFTAGVDVDLGTLPAGKSITVVYTTTVDAPPVATYATHATISGSNFSPAVDSNTATITGDRYNTTTSVGSSKSPAEQGETITFTATVTPTEGSGLTPDGTVNFDFGDSNSASGLACNSASGNTCTAQVTHAFASGGVYLVNASYQGGTNHDPSSTICPFSQTITSCSVNTVVTTNADSGPGSLRQALSDTCGSPGFNTITFDMNPGHPSHVTSPITLTSDELSLAKNVVIQGPGASALTVTRDSGAGSFRIFHNQPNVTSTISGVTVSNGSVVPVGGSFDRDGGAILNQEGTLTLQSMVVTGNSAYGYGSGVLNGTENFEAHATMTILDSTITGNGNGGTGPGGGVANYAGGQDSTLTMTIRRSTISGNGSGGEGGAMRNEPFRGNIVVTATDTTFSGNSSAGNGGAIANMTGVASTSQVTLTNCTITGNQANVPAAGGIGGGIYNTDTLTLRNTIVAGNNNGDVVGTVTSSFNNLIGNGDGAGGLTNGVDGNLVGTGEIPDRSTARTARQ